jgi:hypothetical protein
MINYSNCLAKGIDGKKINYLNNIIW